MELKRNTFSSQTVEKGREEMKDISNEKLGKVKI